ncbi:MAG: DUF1611 domain-containing protein [Candidatus Wallbacteria bacterium]|nr:DUF1611 domain-containing protein [Candidatus Wallbacteria bacterium]
MGYDPSRRILIYAEGSFGRGRSKTAEGVLRYGKNPIAGVVDSTRSEPDVAAVLGPGVGEGVPFFNSLEAALASKPQALLLGIAPPGGQLPQEWRGVIVRALRAGLQLINGLHMELARDPEMAAAAREGGAEIWDVREPVGDFPIANGRVIEVSAQVVLAVGTDCAIGKMTVMLEIEKVALARGRRAKFLATGQTGIMIAGFGVPLDRVIGDFMAGSIEQLILEHAPGADLLLVEGQGSLMHPGFSGVTLSLIHGTAPTHMVLCHDPSRPRVRDSHVPIPPFPEVIALHEQVAGYMRPSKVVAIALNTSSMSDEDAFAAVDFAARETGLPATDPVRFGAEPLFNVIDRAWRQ